MFATLYALCTARLEHLEDIPKMRQVVNSGKGGPMLGHSTCMALKDMDNDNDIESVDMEETVLETVKTM